MKKLKKDKLLKTFKKNPEDFFVKILEEWVDANWDLLCEFKPNDIKKYDERANILLLFASACQHNGDYKRAKIYFGKAIKWGSSLQEMLSICLADISNTKAKISALQKNKKDMDRNFLNAVGISIVKDNVLIAHKRSVLELNRLGLLPQATEQIKEQLSLISDSPNNTDENINAKITILKTELELLSHELSLSQQRMQLYNLNDNKNMIKNDIDIEGIKKRSVSQLGQDIWVLEQTNFKKGGFFVEFGATDGVLLSNTYLLEKEFAWNGICAEPNPEFFKKLKKNRNCKTSNACISGESGEKVEFIFAQEYGGMKQHMSNDVHKDKRKAYLEQGKVVTLATISLDDFLVRMNAPKKIDYLSIDTEGSEFEILVKFPFQKWEISMITVEHNNTKFKDKIFQLLSNYGYTRKTVNWDDWYIKEEKNADK